MQTPNHAKESLCNSVSQRRSNGLKKLAESTRNWADITETEQAGGRDNVDTASERDHVTSKSSSDDSSQYTNDERLERSRYSHLSGRAKRLARIELNKVVNQLEYMIERRERDPNCYKAEHAALVAKLEGLKWAAYV